MIVVQQQLHLAASATVVWDVLSDLETLIRADPLHRSVAFVGQQRRGIGTTALVWHGLPVGPTFPRRLHVTGWEEGRCIRWTDVNVHEWLRRFVFPHSEEYVITPVGKQSCVLTDTVRGSIKLGSPLVRQCIERSARLLVVQQVVRLEDRALRRLVVARQMLASERQASLDGL